MQTTFVPRIAPRPSYSALNANNFAVINNSNQIEVFHRVPSVLTPFKALAHHHTVHVTFANELILLVERDFKCC